MRGHRHGRGQRQPLASAPPDSCRPAGPRTSGPRAPLRPQRRDEPARGVGVGREPREARPRRQPSGSGIGVVATRRRGRSGGDAMGGWQRIAVEEGGRPGSSCTAPIAPAISVMRRLSPMKGVPPIGTTLAAVLRDELAALVMGTTPRGRSDPRRRWRTMPPSPVVMFFVSWSEQAPSAPMVRSHGRGTKRRSTVPRPRESGCGPRRLQAVSASMSHTTFSRWTGTIAASAFGDLPPRRLPGRA